MSTPTYTIERRPGSWALILECPPGCGCGTRTVTEGFMSEHAASQVRDVILDGWNRGIPPEGLIFPPQRRRVTGDLFPGGVPNGAIYVSRAAPGLTKSKFANPYKGDSAAARYRECILGDPGLLAAARTELVGKSLACWCGPGAACHADVLIELANEPA